MDGIAWEIEESLAQVIRLDQMRVKPKTALRMLDKLVALMIRRKMLCVSSSAEAAFSLSPDASE
jgi:hypothetical protein